VTATSMINLYGLLAGTNLNLSWSGGQSPFVIERTFNLSSASWSGVLTTATLNAAVPINSTNSFFRVRGQ